MRFILMLMFSFFANIAFASECPGEQMTTGWCYPTGTNNAGGHLGWHGDGNFSGMHLAQDIKGNDGDPVYAVADGRVMIARNDVSNYGGAKDCAPTNENGTQIPGAGMIIRHVTGDGKEFDALYSHLKDLEFSAGAYVKKGQRIGKLRNYTWCGSRQDHLHFGIEYPKRDDECFGVGCMVNIWAGYGSTDSGFVCPMFVDQNCSTPFLSRYSAGRMYRVVCSSNYCWEPVSGSDACADAADHWMGDPNVGAPGVSASEACGQVVAQCASPPNVSTPSSSPTLFERFWLWIQSQVKNIKNETSVVDEQALCMNSYTHTAAWFNGVSAVIANDDLVFFSIGPVFPAGVSIINPASKILPNMRIWSVGLFDGSQELNEGQSILEANHTYDVHIHPIAEGADATNGVDSDTENVETDVFYKLALDKSEGSWSFLCRVYTRPSTLVANNPHKENCFITVTEEMAGKRLYLRAKADSTGEVEETDEGDNWSNGDKEWYPIRGSCNLAVSWIGLDDGKASLLEGESYGLRAAVRNIGTTGCPGETRLTYYEKRPGWLNFAVVADDGSDANQLLPGVDQWEHTMNQPFTANVVGTTEIMACADTNGANAETDETDNCLTSAFDVRMYRSDLIVSSLNLCNGKTRLKVGDRFGLCLTVQNIGPKGSGGSRVKYELKPPGGNFSQVADDGVASLLPGASNPEETLNEPFTATASGWWEARATADYQGSEAESDEGNNVTTYLFYVDPTGSDFYVADMYIKVGSAIHRAGSTIKKGSYVHPYCVVGNRGNLSTHPGFRLAYYIDADKYRDDDGVDPNQTCVGCLVTEYVSSDSIKLGDAGTRTYRCKIDYQGSVAELNEGNNEAAFTFFVK